MKRASIDIGSNSVLLLAVEYDLDSKSITKEFLNESSITSLGKDLDKTLEFLQTSMEATLEALKSYRQMLIANGFKDVEVIVTATEASRVAKNAHIFYDKVLKETGFKVQVISSEGEAYYTALGVVSSLKPNALESVVVMDIGGASTELIKINLHPFKIIESISMPVGSVRATDWNKEGQLDAKLKEIFKENLNSYKTKTLICVAGSMTALASMYLGQRVFEDKKIDGLELTFGSFRDFARDLQSTNVENLLLLFPFLGKRAPMVACGSKVAVEIGNRLEIENIKISTRGLRYGTVITGGIHDEFINK